MLVSITPVNPAFKSFVFKYLAESEHPHYTFVRTEGPRDSIYVFDCDEENPWTVVDGVKAAIRRPPLGNIMFCQVVPYGMITWPPLVDKDKYPRPEK